MQTESVRRVHELDATLADRQLDRSALVRSYLDENAEISESARQGSPKIA